MRRLRCDGVTCRSKPCITNVTTAAAAAATIIRPGNHRRRRAAASKDRGARGTYRPQLSSTSTTSLGLGSQADVMHLQRRWHAWERFAPEMPMVSVQADAETKRTKRKKEKAAAAALKVRVRPVTCLGRLWEVVVVHSAPSFAARPSIKRVRRACSCPTESRTQRAAMSGRARGCHAITTRAGRAMHGGFGRA